MDYDVPPTRLIQTVAETRPAEGLNNFGTVTSSRADGSVAVLQYNYNPANGVLIIVTSQPTMIGQGTSWITNQQTMTYGGINHDIGAKMVAELSVSQGMLPQSLNNLVQTGFSCVQTFNVTDKGKIGTNDAQIARGPKGDFRFFMNGREQPTAAITYPQAISIAQGNCSQANPAPRQAPR